MREPFEKLGDLTRNNLSLMWGHGTKVEDMELRWGGRGYGAKMGKLGQGGGV